VTSPGQGGSEIAAERIHRERKREREREREREKEGEGPVKRHNVPPFKGASTGMRRRADDVTRIDEARCAAHANAGNLKRQLEQRRRCNDDAERLPGFRGDSIRSWLPGCVRDDSRRTRERRSLSSGANVRAVVCQTWLREGEGANPFSERVLINGTVVVGYVIKSLQLSDRGSPPFRAPTPPATLSLICTCIRAHVCLCLYSGYKNHGYDRCTRAWCLIAAESETGAKPPPFKGRFTYLPEGAASRKLH